MEMMAEGPRIYWQGNKKFEKKKGVFQTSAPCMPLVGAREVSDSHAIKKHTKRKNNNTSGTDQQGQFHVLSHWYRSCRSNLTSYPVTVYSQWAHQSKLSIYLVLFVLQVAHKASTRARQRCRSAETRSRQPHVQPFSFISLSTVLLQVSLGRPLFLWPSGVHHRAILVKAVVCWWSTYPNPPSGRQLPLGFGCRPSSVQSPGVLHYCRHQCKLWCRFP